MFKARRVLYGLQTPTARRGLRHKVFGLLWPREVIRRLAPRLIVDVGANRGQFSLDVAAVAPNARIVAFEPLGTEADVFESVHPDSSHVELRRIALSDTTGTATLHESNAADSSSLLPISSQQIDHFPGTEERRSLTVQTSTLDAQFPDGAPPGTLLKLDVQGAELSVLQGGEAFLENVDNVLVECSFLEFYSGQALSGDIVTFLGSHGFELAEVVDVTFSKGRAVQADLLFRNKRHPREP